VTDDRLKLLFVDDDDLIVQSVKMLLPSNWRMVHSLSLKNLDANTFDAAFVDMHLTPQSLKLKTPEGLKIIHDLNKQNPHLEIVAISGDLDRDLMESCLQNGASRYLAKPLAPEEFKLVLEKIEALILLKNATHRAFQTSQAWMGSSSKSNDVRKQIAALQNESGPILIEGESGTGKEVAAHLIHGPKSEKPFIAVNIAAIPEKLFESEMFGHVRGAFTGADQNKIGLAEAASGGDLFIDEIEALPLALQPILLRFLESGEIRRVGGKDNIKLNVRVIVATNQNLNQMVKEQKFRDDLLWRLNGKKILLPPLRERKEDILELAEYFLQKEKPRRNKTIADDAKLALSEYHFPGNVRELKRICEQLSLYSPLPIIRKDDVVNCLPRTLHQGVVENIDLKIGLTDVMQAYEARIIAQAIKLYPDIDELAQVLKVSRSNLYKKLKDHNIELPN
jgi:DNA-binding NtrC family response regulator